MPGQPLSPELLSKMLAEKDLRGPSFLKDTLKYVQKLIRAYEKVQKNYERAIAQREKPRD